MKKAFTLVEVIISIIIFALIMMFLYKSIANLRLNNKNLKHTVSKSKNISKIIYLLKNDIILAKKIDLKLLTKDTLVLETTSSIEQISKPKVTWKVLKRSKKLVRIEEVKEKKIIRDTTIKCSKFKLYYNKKEHKLLVFIKTLNNQKYIFEVPTYN